MYTADNARNAAEMKNCELIRDIEESIRRAAEQFENSVMFRLDSKLSRKAVEKIADMFRDAPRHFAVGVIDCGDDGMTVKYRCLNITW